MRSNLNRIRVAVHALDRTGPPMLALAFGRWLRANHPNVAIDVVAFRGGPLIDEAETLGTCTVLTHPQEPWDHDAPDPARVHEVRSSAGVLAPADATLLVSVAAGQVLPYLDGGGSIVTWCVELGEDLHWLDGPLGLVERTDRWMAGADVVRDDLARRAGVDASSISIAGEFVTLPDVERTDLADVAQRVRADLEVRTGELLLIGAGIATLRKAPDLFVEVAAARRRADPDHREHAHWIGGVDDELFGPLQREIRRVGLSATVGLHPPVADLDGWLAAADVFVHPARLDAFPLVCLHAAALGTPVVAFAGVGGVEEMFGPAFRGVPYPDVEGLAALVGELRDPDRRAELGEAQQRRVQEHWSAEVGAPRVLAVVEEVAQCCG